MFNKEETAAHKTGTAQHNSIWLLIYLFICAIFFDGAKETNKYAQSRNFIQIPKF